MIKIKIGKIINVVSNVFFGHAVQCLGLTPPKKFKMTMTMTTTTTTTTYTEYTDTQYLVAKLKPPE